MGYADAIVARVTPALPGGGGNIAKAVMAQFAVIDEPHMLMHMVGLGSYPSDAAKSVKAGNIILNWRQLSSKSPELTFAVAGGLALQPAAPECVFEETGGREAVGRTDAGPVPAEVRHVHARRRTSAGQWPTSVRPTTMPHEMCFLREARWLAPFAALLIWRDVKELIEVPITKEDAAGRCRGARSHVAKQKQRKQNKKIVSTKGYR